VNFISLEESKIMAIAPNSLSSLIRRSGMTQREVARRSSIPESRLSALCHSKAVMSTPELSTLAGVLSVNPERLLDPLSGPSPEEAAQRLAMFFSSPSGQSFAGDLLLILGRLARIAEGGA
jgi:transcriptional regulator with XRE-family HTH domain